MITFNFPVSYENKRVNYKLALITDDPIDLDLGYQINLLSTPMGSIPTMDSSFGVPFFAKDIMGEEAYKEMLRLLAPDIDIENTNITPF